MEALVEFLPKLFWWHFFEAPFHILRAIKNFLKFGAHYFSLGFILRTFFYPWRRMYIITQRFDPWKILEAMIFNIFSTFIGMIFRVFILFFGIIFEILVLIFGILILIAWIFLPLIFFILIFYGGKILGKI
ncbi:hypothetical protein H5T58_00705 [Candidatus Parcubacteria bacterium]|nr:hypothetical protein [Candidatus Parcubacteria bacterium]